MSEQTKEREPISHADWLRVRRESQERERAMRSLVERRWRSPGSHFSVAVSIDYDNRVRVHIEHHDWMVSSRKESTAIVNGDVCNLPTQVLLAYGEVRRVVEEWVTGKRDSLPGDDWEPFGPVKNLTEADRAE